MKFAFIVLSVLLSLPAAAQPDRFDKVQIKTTQLAQNIYMLEGEGGNIGVSVGEDGVFLIDDPLMRRNVSRWNRKNARSRDSRLIVGSY